MRDGLCDEEPDQGDEWRAWYQDDPELEGDGETEGNVKKKEERKGKEKGEGKGGARSSNLVEG